MTHLNFRDNFAGRVNFAAKVIAECRTATRNFDNCFENDDGDAVAAALMCRAERNPKIAENLPRYLDMAKARECHARLAGLNLADEARRMREA